MTDWHNNTKHNAVTFLLTVLTFFGFLNGFSQNKIVAEVQKLQRENTLFTPLSVLTTDASISKTEIDKTVTDATLAKADLAKINTIATGTTSFIALEVPFQGTTITVLLYRVNPFSDAFVIDTDKQSNIAYQKGAYYRGIIKGNPNSVAAFNFFKGAFNGIVSSNELGNVVVGKIDKPNNVTDYIVYSDANFLVSNDFTCHVKEDGLPAKEATMQRDANTLKCVTFYYEVDYDLYLSNNSSIETAANWATSVFNNVQTLFANDGITTALNAVYVWTTPDVYEGIGTASSDYLQAFQYYRPVINGDVGVLVGIDPGGLGGVAYLNGLCTDYNYGYSDVNGISVATVPTYSWTTQVMTHELGHLMGSPHTHACAWNGNNTPIDGCGSEAGYPEQGCSLIGPIPSSIIKGTIMSYCHLISGVGISFANGFGLQPATLMANTINSKPCLGADCTACINTASDFVASNVTENTAALSWSGMDDGDSWEVSVTTLNATEVWNTVTQPTYLATGLLPNTYYQLKIKPFCTNVNPVVRTYYFATSGNYCGSLSFSDTGGLGSNYGDRESFIRTITPNLPNKKIVVTFNQFSLETDYDYLYIYDGADTTFPELNSGNGYTGTNSPGTVTSTATDGALTFQFYSDQYTTASGWDATINCQENLGVATSDYLDFMYYPNPTSHTVQLRSNTTITEVEVYTIEGQKLYGQKLETLETKVDLSQFATGTYFFKVKFNDVQKNFKILKL